MTYSLETSKSDAGEILALIEDIPFDLSGVMPMLKHRARSESSSSSLGWIHSDEPLLVYPTVSPWRCRLASLLAVLAYLGDPLLSASAGLTGGVRATVIGLNSNPDISTEFGAARQARAALRTYDQLIGRISVLTLEKVS